MNYEQLALYKAICENPLDDTPRLVYADWLEESGDENNAIRAEYIRLSIAAEYPPKDASFVDVANWVADKKRAEDMLAENYTKWTITRCRMCDEKNTESICKFCGNTRNAFSCVVRTGQIHDEEIYAGGMRGVSYHKGFPVGITCKISELFADIGGYEFNYSHRWATSIVEDTPILMFKPTGYRPGNMIARRERFYIWYADISANVSNYEREVGTSVLPTYLFRLTWDLAQNYAGVKRTHNPNWGGDHIVCRSAEQAYEILSRAIGNEIRKRVYQSAPQTSP